MNTRLHQSIRRFDRALRKPALQRLSLESAAQNLEEMTRFFLHADTAAEDEISLVAAGCRLSSDLSEAMISRLQDAMLAHDAAIAALSRQLGERLKAREQASRLLCKAQALREQTQTTAEAAGLGVIL
jgi:hypothetical protein